MYAELLTHNILRVQTRTGKAMKKSAISSIQECNNGMPEESCDQLQYQAHRKMDHKMRQSAEKKKVELEKANEIAREHIPPRLPPRFIKEFPSPPPIFRSRCNSDDVPCLKIKLFFNGGSVVVQRFYCKSHVSKRRKQRDGENTIEEDLITILRRLTWRRRLR